MRPQSKHNTLIITSKYSFGANKYRVGFKIGSEDRGEMLLSVQFAKICSTLELTVSSAVLPRKCMRETNFDVTPQTFLI